MLIVVYKKWGNEEVVCVYFIDEFLKFYVCINVEVEIDFSVDEEVCEWFCKFEVNDFEVIELW